MSMAIPSPIKDRRGVQVRLRIVIVVCPRLREVWLCRRSLNDVGSCLSSFVSRIKSRVYRSLAVGVGYGSQVDGHSALLITIVALGAVLRLYDLG